MCKNKISVFVTLVLGAASCANEEAEEAAPLRINELLPSNSAVNADEAGEYDDWLEIYNGTDAEVSLEGYYLSDDDADHFKERLPAGLTVAAGGVLLLWADRQPEQGANHLPFKLSAAGEAVFLSAPDATLLDSVTFGATSSDQSLARFPDGSGEVATCAMPTPHALNGSSCVAD